MKITVNNLQYKKLLKEFRLIEAKDFLDYPIKITPNKFMPEDVILIDDKLIFLRKTINKGIRLSNKFKLKGNKKNEL